MIKRALKTRLIFLFSMNIVLMVSCGSLNPTQKNTEPLNHETFSVLLKKYVDQQGRVDYGGFAKERELFDTYLNNLKTNPPNEDNWSISDQIAYWINAYNAFTIQLILDNYPIESIKDIGSKIQIPFINTPWDIKFIEINGEEYDLNNFEHNILRKNYDEPRIHFAIVCASFSCPNLRPEAYIGTKLEEQLVDQTRKFLSDESKNKISSDRIEISKIFSWFKGDFTKKTSLIEFLNQYAPVKVSPKAKVTHMAYDWSLNDQNPSN